MRVYAAAAPLIIILLVAGSAGQTNSPSRYDAGFWRVWGDGQAELTSYDLTEPHYGSPRRGVAVAIFVTETFSNSARVKSDPGKHPRSDEFPVMKLNLVKDFRTGIYDYNDMTSSFLALAGVNNRPAGTLTKLSFSSQEWCGNVYHQMLFDAQSIRSTRHSYFDGEADEQTTLPYPGDGVSADALWMWARGMAEPFLAPGQSRKAPLLTSLQTVRDTHRGAHWTPATFSRSADRTLITVPAGRFRAELWTVSAQDYEQKFWISTNSPHWVLRWESKAGEKGEMLSTIRAKYWTLNKPGGEQQLRRLRLNPRPPRTT